MHGFADASLTRCEESRVATLSPDTVDANVVDGKQRGESSDRRGESIHNGAQIFRILALHQLYDAVTELKHHVRSCQRGRRLHQRVCLVQPCTTAIHRGAPRWGLNS
jgi:hypothetical protein